MWTYKQRTGELFNRLGHLAGTGYSGASGPYKNNPMAQSVKDEGPLPCGLYIIDSPYNSMKTGEYTLALYPDVDNQMFGRDGFKIHGDSVSNPGGASDGCIVMPLLVRHLVWNSGDRLLTVISGDDASATQSAPSAPSTPPR